jgi:hypothetical protein
MSSKVDSLLKKATTFERLALYGDRTFFLQALAQQSPTSDPDPWRIYDEPNDPRGQENNWAPQILNGQKIYTYMGPNVPAGSVQHTPSLWDKYLRPHQFPETPNVVVPPTDHSDNAPQVDRDPNIMMQKQLNAPAVPEQDKPTGPAVGKQVKFDPRVKVVQDFLNQQLTQGTQAVAPPITPDGKWGNETAGMLRLWGKHNKLPLDLNGLFEMAQAKASTDATVKSLQPGPNLQSAR